MRANKRSPRRLHAALKAVGGDGADGARRAIKFVVAFTVVGAALWGTWIGVCKLRDLWIEQCVVTDVKSQVSVSATAHISEDIVREWFGLTNGCNLALIDFGAIRKRVLKDYPIVKDLSVTRHLPNRLEVALLEREPVARVNLKRTTVKRNGRDMAFATWDVVDIDGVVFDSSKKDTQTLPVIIDSSPSAPRGGRLEGHAMSALRFIEIANRENLPYLQNPEISISNAVNMMVTLRNYSHVQIQWRMLDDPSDPAQPTLTKTLVEINKAINENLNAERGTFIVVEPGRFSHLPNEGGSFQ